MSTHIVKLWQVFCIQEGINVNVWGVDAPTLCPNDHVDRTIDPTKTRMVNYISTKKVQIETAEQGFYQARSSKVIVPAGNAGDITTYDFSHPMDISILEIGFNTTSNMVGDEISFVALPETQIGVLTQDANISDTVLNVPSTTVNLPNLVKGMEIVIENVNNNPTKEDLGRITAINKDTFQITVETASSQLFAAGTLVKINTYPLRNFVIQKADSEHTFGRKGVGAREIPANGVTRVVYTNNNGQAKTFYINTEYYFR